LSLTRGRSAAMYNLVSASQLIDMVSWRYCSSFCGIHCSHSCYPIRIGLVL